MKHEIFLTSPPPSPKDAPLYTKVWHNWQKPIMFPTLLPPLNCPSTRLRPPTTTHLHAPPPNHSPAKSGFKRVSKRLCSPPTVPLLPLQNQAPAKRGFKNVFDCANVCHLCHSSDQIPPLPGRELKGRFISPLGVRESAKGWASRRSGERTNGGVITARLSSPIPTKCAILGRGATPLGLIWLDTLMRNMPRVSDMVALAGFLCVAECLGLR